MHNLSGMDKYKGTKTMDKDAIKKMQNLQLTLISYRVVEIDKEHIKVAVERIKYWSKTKIKEETTKPKLF